MGYNYSSDSIQIIFVGTFILPDCHLSENTIRILQHIFGKVIPGALSIVVS